MKKKWLLLLSSSLLLSSVIGNGVLPATLSFDSQVHAESSVASSSEQSSNEDTKKDTFPQSDTLKDNFYRYVNKEWLENTVIPPSESSVDDGSINSNAANDKLNQDFLDMISGTKTMPDKELEPVINFFKLARDYERLDKDGITPLKAQLDKIKAIKSLNDVQTLLPEWIFYHLPVPVKYDVETSPEGPFHALTLDTAKTILPDSAYYEKQERHDELMAKYREFNTALLEEAGYTKEEATELVENTIKYDRKIYEALGNSDSEDFDTLSQEDVQKYSDAIDLKQLATDLAIDSSKKVTIYENHTQYFKSLNTLFNTDSLEELKAWLTLNLIQQNAGFLSDNLRVKNSQFKAYLSGTKELDTRDRHAFKLLNRTFGEEIGVYYGKTYFGEKAKKDVEDIVKQILAVHREQLLKNEWLSKETTEKAVKKIDTMRMFVGYPEQYPTYDYAVAINPEQSLYENNLVLNKQSIQHQFTLIDQPEDKDKWSTEAHVANAFYSPTNNSISFPAGFLQKPFYDPEQTISENYGAIGATIGHEITHAFDEHGSTYDENGELKEWWTEADRKAFESRTQALIDQWSAIVYDGYELDGAQYLGENIADAGGLVVAYAALMKHDNADPKQFFESYARSWRTKQTPEHLEEQIATDEHPPAELRVLVPLRNLDIFYEAYDIKPGDPMYLAPEKRVNVW